MIRRLHKGIGTICLAAVLLGGAAGAWADQVGLDVGLSHPVVLAGEKPIVYLRVALTGFEMERTQERPPVNLAVVLDKSGSMQGEKIAEARRAAVMALQRLDMRDIASVVTYDSTVNVLAPATRLSDRASLFGLIRSIPAGGNTALFGGVCKGADELRKFLAEEYVNRVILLSDGIANVGPSSPGELGELGASLRKEGIAVSTVGLGLDYNEDLMTQLALNSVGNHYFVENARDLARIYERELGDVLAVVARDARVDIKCAPGVRPVRTLAGEGEITGQHILVDFGQIASGGQRSVIIELELPNGEVGESRQLASVDLRYRNLQTQAEDRLHAAVSARYTDSEREVEEATNRDVMVPTIMMLAVENNQNATLLRDQGKVEEARRLLFSNNAFLSSNATLYRAPELTVYADENLADAENLDEENWKRQRKGMRSSQAWKVFE